MRNGTRGCRARKLASTIEPSRSIPHSPFRIPHWGRGVVAAVRVGVDVGGTFTDLVALGVDGTLQVRKVTTTPDDPAVGMFRAVGVVRCGRHFPDRSEE